MPPSDEHRMIRDTARAFARDRLAPNAAEWDRTETVATDAIREMGGLGFLGMLVPAEWDGAEAGFTGYALALEEIAVGDAGCATAAISHNSLVCTMILGAGSEAQKEHFLKPLARGEYLGCFCLTEPQAGSDAANLRTRARRDGDDYVISGTKQFVTNGATADVAIVNAVTDPDAGPKGISSFIVPTDLPGWTVARLEKKLGQKSCEAAQIVLDELRLPADHRLGAEGAGYAITLANLEGSRIGIAAQAVGVARAAFEASAAYAKERETFGRPIIEHQAVAFKLADMATQIDAARTITMHAAALRDSGYAGTKEASIAKLFTTEMAERVCSDAIQIHGGYGYLNDFPVERLYRDSRIGPIYEGTSEVQRMVISRTLMDA